MVDSFEAPGPTPGQPPSSLAPPPPPPPAGWYPDGSGGHRYWDGVRWIAHQPASAAVTGPALAPWGRRIPAFIIDMVLLVPGSVLFVVVWVHEFTRVIDAANTNGTAPAPRFGLLFLSWLLNLGFQVLNRGVVQGLTGKSLGKLIMKVRVVRIEDGGNPGLGWGLLRILIETVAGLVDVVVAFVNDRHQRLGDLAGKTMVVEDSAAAEMRASRGTRVRER